MPTTIAHIICPVDLSPTSQRALEYALAWARTYESRVRVLHVVSPPVPIVGPGSYGAVMLPRRPMAEIQAEVSAFVSQVPSLGVPVDIDIREGDAAKIVREVANEDTHAVLVMGTHGRWGLDRVLIGSTTERVAHHTGRPLLVIPPHDATEETPKATFTNIVCAVDFRPSSLAALRCALSFAKDTDARLDVVTVLEIPPDDESWAFQPYGASEYRTERSKELLEQLHDLTSDEDRHFCWIREEVLAGRPATELLRHADEQSADLIVMGTGERFPVGLRWLGHATDRVMRLAKCPVMIVPAMHRLMAQDASPLGPEQWVQELDRMTLQHQGEPTTVSILDEVMGAEHEATALPLVGLTAESHAGHANVAVILGRPDGTRLTHFVNDPRVIRVGEARDHRRLELLIASADGTTTVVDVGAA